MARPTKRGFAAKDPDDRDGADARDGDQAAETVFGRDVHLPARPPVGRAAPPAPVSAPPPAPPRPVADDSLLAIPTAPRHAMSPPTEASRPRATGPSAPPRSGLTLSSIVIVFAAAAVSFLIAFLLLQTQRP